MRSEERFPLSHLHGCLCHSLPASGSYCQRLSQVYIWNIDIHRDLQPHLESVCGSLQPLNTRYCHCVPHRMSVMFLLLPLSSQAIRRFPSLTRGCSGSNIGCVGAIDVVIAVATVMLVCRFNNCGHHRDTNCIWHNCCGSRIVV
eukprot:Blabericola_migrator_1__3305@NODE_1974_length_3482_cov_11_377745_g1257_i0_p2_GENE_NODE_1974_length_3482_cov_11_377745_g1257_i0NODE_1974_length_3482_cov_11_377745_g1257_i0_p2_ORF_typecomplete_len144_score5_512oxoacid_dh/PF00198_23/0_22_NODE_1974_length_3482_cov_11_377745_g1257_i013511782